MKKSILVFSLLFLAFHSNAQYKYPNLEHAEKALMGTLYVQINEGRTDQEIAINEVLKEQFEGQWQGAGVEFKTVGEIEKLKSLREEGKAFLTYNNAKLQVDRTLYYSSEKSASPYSGRSITHTILSFSYFDFNLETVIGGKMETVTQVAFADNNLREGDIVFLVQQLNMLLENAAKGVQSKTYGDVENKIELVKTSKLMILKDYFKEKDLEKIDKSYEYDFDLVDLATQEKTIIEKIPGQSYIKIVWSHQHHLYVWIVVNAEDGNILSINSFGGVKLGTEHEADDLIKPKNLKYIDSKMAQNINNKY